MDDKPVCPGCGVESNGLCVECYLKNRDVSFKKFKLTRCECGKIKDTHIFTDNMRDVIGNYLGRAIKYPQEFNNPSFSFKYEIDGKKIKTDVKVKAKFNGIKFSKDYLIEVPITNIVCPECARLNSGYYEAVLQVRTDKFDEEKQLDSDKVSKLDKVPGGWDYYITDLRYAKGLCKNLANQGYLIKESTERFGSIDGVEVFRYFFSIKKPVFSEGDLIKIGERIFKVANISMDVVLVDILRSLKVKKPLSRLDDVEVYLKSENVKKGQVNEVRPDGVQLMDLESFELYDVKNPGGLNPGDEVGFILIENNACLV